MKGQQKKKREKEPAYYLSAIHTKTINYNVYYLSLLEKTLYFLAAFLVGALVGYLFYGGIGKDAYGDATTVTKTLDVLIPGSVGLAAGINFLSIRADQLRKNRQLKLRRQFIDLLESLVTSISSGNNVPNAFTSAKADLMVQYSEEDFIVKEVDLIISSIENGVAVENVLKDFGMRSGIADVENFGVVFRTTYRKGGNLKDIIRKTHEIISDKVAIELEIQTKVASNKNEQNMMFLMPVMLVGMMKMTGEDFAKNFTTVTGVISTTVAIGLFVVAYFVGKKILDIKA